MTFRMTAIPIPRQVINGDAVQADSRIVHVYFNQVVKVLYQFCLEVLEFNRVRYFSCRCKLFWKLILSVSDDIFPLRKHKINAKSA